jgi:hypothetical protein
VFAVILAQETGGVQIHFAAKDLAEFNLSSSQSDHADSGTGIEFDQNIHVAGRGEIISQNGTEQGQSTNTIRPAKVGYLLLRYVQACYFSSSIKARERPSRSGINEIRKAVHASRVEQVTRDA